MNIALESPDQPDVIALIAELDAYQETLYPPESRHPLDLASLKRDDVRFFVTRDDAGVAQGCCAVVLRNDHGEIKRLFVRPACRGRGIAAGLLRAVEDASAEAGRRHLMLETGTSQHEALGLYGAAGYVRRGPFHDYRDDPLSVFMEKRLA
jgi:putative acetyltransferase